MTKYKLSKIFSSDVIAAKIKNYAVQINQKYQNKSLIVIVVLRGALYFAADLTKALSKDLDLKINFISYQSYIANQKHTINNYLQSQLKDFENQDLSNKHILILDDILDTGKTLKNLHKIFSVYQPASINFGVLIKAEPSVNKIDFGLSNVDALFTWKKTLEQNWLIGYGMDLDDYGRHFPEIYVLKTK